MTSPTDITTSTRRNVMGGTNVLMTLPSGERLGVRSYATASNARRAIRSGAAVRTTLRIERTYRDL